MQVKCNQCKYIGDESEFPKGRDFLQNRYVASCPKCNNEQSPGGASMRMFEGKKKRPFVYMRSDASGNDALDIVLHRAEEAS